MKLDPLIEGKKPGITSTQFDRLMYKNLREIAKAYVEFCKREAHDEIEGWDKDVEGEGDIEDWTEEFALKYMEEVTKEMEEKFEMMVNAKIGIG